MSMKKSLLALAVLAFAMMGLSSSAMAATDGVLRDVKTNEIVPKGHVTHFKGWARFGSKNGGTVCHSESTATATNAAGTEGTATFEVPSAANCTSEIPGCQTVTSVEVKNSPYHLTVTPTDFDVSGNIVITNHYTGSFCLFPTVTVEFSEVTLKPLKTGEKVATNTNNKLGTTAGPEEEIAGVEISGVGKSPQVGAVEAEGELEIQGEDISTWEIASS